MQKFALNIEVFSNSVFGPGNSNCVCVQSNSQEYQILCQVYRKKAYELIQLSGLQGALYILLRNHVELK